MKIFPLRKLMKIYLIPINQIIIIFRRMIKINFKYQMINKQQIMENPIFYYKQKKNNFLDNFIIQNYLIFQLIWNLIKIKIKNLHML